MLPGNDCDAFSLTFRAKDVSLYWLLLLTKSKHFLERVPTHFQLCVHTTFRSNAMVAGASVCFSSEQPEESL